VAGRFIVESTNITSWDETIVLACRFFFVGRSSFARSQAGRGAVEPYELPVLVCFR
jgi:hypothetical protein